MLELTRLKRSFVLSSILMIFFLLFITSNVFAYVNQQPAPTSLPATLPSELYKYYVIEYDTCGGGYKLSSIDTNDTSKIYFNGSHIVFKGSLNVDEYYCSNGSTWTHRYHGSYNNTADGFEGIYYSNFDIKNSDGSMFFSCKPYGSTISGSGSTNSIESLYNKDIDSQSYTIDPVNTATGAHEIEKTLLKQASYGDFKFDVKYNSLITTKGLMGNGWDNNYDMRLQISGNNVIVNWPDFYKNTFNLNQNNIYTSTDTSMYNYVLIKNNDGTYTLTDKDKNVYYFDSSGKVTEQTNKHGQPLHYQYDSNGNLINVKEDISGHFYSFGYNSSGLLSKVSDGTNRTVSFSYDSNSNLTKITDANGNNTNYTYSAANQVLSSYYDDGTYVFKDTYDNDGRVSTQDDALSTNRLTTFSYDETSQLGYIITNVTDRNGNSKVYTHDKNYNLIKIKDELGNTKSYTYDSQGNRLSYTDANGNTENYTYDSNNNLLITTDATSSETQYSYDSNNNLTSQKNPDGGVTQYTYDSNNNITKMIDTRGNVTTYSYDANGLLLEKDVNSNKYTYTYQNGLKTTATDSQSGITSYTYDGAGNVITTTDAKKNVTNYSYDNEGHVLSKKDPNGGTVSYTYDNRENLLTETDANGNKTSYTYNGNNKVTSMTDAKGAITTYSYDGEDRETQIKNANGNTISTAYDATGRSISKTDASGNTTKYAYDSAGNILTTTNPSGGKITDTYFANNKLKTETDGAGNTSTYKYDTDWRLSSITDAAGNTKFYAYDTQGNLLSEKDGAGDLTNYSYDANGNLIKKVDSNGNITTYTYDGNNNRLSMTDALGKTIKYAYDADNKVISITDGNGNSTAYAYDANGRLSSQTDALGDTSSIFYDANGNTVKKTDGNGNSTTYAYDADNLLTSSVDPLGDKTSNSYDSLGNLSQTVDAMGNKETYKYDANGKLVSVTDANNGVSLCQYTADGKVSSLTGALGSVTNYTYDGEDRITSESTPSNGQITYTYNSENLMSELTNARGQKKDYTYDAAGRISSFKNAEGTTSYSYDKNGNVLTVTDSQGTISRQYDALNRVIKYTDVNNNVVQYVYDAAGNITTIIYPNGSKVNYSYDAANRLIKVTDWENRITSYSYDKNGNLVQTQRPDGSVLTEVYDPAERLKQMKDLDESGNIIYIEDYTYNADGQITKEVTQNGQMTADSKSCSMTYDSLNRLLSRNDTNISGASTGSYAYSYDAAGNITSTSSNVTMSYDNNNRLITYNGNNITYDADGNMSNGLLKGVSSDFAYDSENRLIQAGSTTYGYDALNNRIWQAVNGNKTNYVYDNTSSDLSRLLVSTDSNGNSTYYIYGVGLIGEQDPNSSYSIYHYDLRGSTIAITNMQKTVTDRYSYGPYGELISHTGTATTPFLYNGRDGVMTDSNGLYYMRARYYSTDMERFINADILKGSIENGETLNNYAYANGNPISMVDPFGRCADETNESSESIFSEIGEFGSNLYNELNNDAIYITGYDIDFNLNAVSMGEYGALAETGEDALKGADELGGLLNKVVGEAPSAEKIVWPPNDGGILGTEKNIVLEKGYQFDRYGLNTGSYVAPVGTSYEMRSLAPGTEFKPYKVFEVAKPVRGEGSVTAPWFDQSGGGIQIKLNNTIQELLDSGRIIEVKK